jgi:hypothetical protein
MRQREKRSINTLFVHKRFGELRLLGMDLRVFEGGRALGYAGNYEIYVCDIGN